MIQGTFCLGIPSSFYGGLARVPQEAARSIYDEVACLLTSCTSPLWHRYFRKNKEGHEILSLWILSIGEFGLRSGLETVSILLSFPVVEHPG